VMPTGRRQVQVLGVAAADDRGTDAVRVPAAPAGALATLDCCCPEFCELDHANE
jgi:hypothetical protein